MSVWWMESSDDRTEGVGVRVDSGGGSEAL